MPVILDDSDFLTEWDHEIGGKEAKRILSLIKYTAEMTNPRDILSQDSKRKNLPFCAYPMFTRNTGLITEDGFIRRATSHDFTLYDEKSKEEFEQYNTFLQQHKDTLGFLGDFVIDYYLECPNILFNNWLAIAKRILYEFYAYAGVVERGIVKEGVEAGALGYEYMEVKVPEWLLGEVVDSATSQDALAEVRSSDIAAMLHDMVQNQGWGRNKRECAIWIAKNKRGDLLAGVLDYNLGTAKKTIDDVMTTATLEEKTLAVTALNCVPSLKWHEDKKLVCIMPSITEELKKRGISRVAHTQLPSYCGTGFFYDRALRFGGSRKQHRAICAKIEDFIAFIDPTVAEAMRKRQEEEAQKLQ
jgi:hypothetical protein